MNALEASRSALADLAAHKLRSVLTMLGMIFGVGAVIAMLSIGAGAERHAKDKIERMGQRHNLGRGREAASGPLENGSTGYPTLLFCVF